jgi:hypothetical protein
MIEVVCNSSPIIALSIIGKLDKVKPFLDI